MKKGKLLLLGSIFLTLALGSCTRDNYSTPQSDYVLNGVDNEFMRRISFNNYKEIHLGIYASNHATDMDLKEYAVQMIEEHTKAQQDLIKLAKQFRVTLPESVSQEDMAEIEALKNTPDGIQFDNKYLSSELQDHNSALLYCDKEIKTGNHKMVIDYARTFYVMEQGHLGVATP